MSLKCQKCVEHMILVYILRSDLLKAAITAIEQNHPGGTPIFSLEDTTNVLTDPLTWAYVPPQHYVAYGSEYVSGCLNTPSLFPYSRTSVGSVPIGRFLWVVSVGKEVMFSPLLVSYSVS